MRVTHEDVISVYKILLQREPESPDVMNHWVSMSAPDLRRHILASEEFVSRFGHEIGVAAPEATLQDDHIRVESRKLEHLALIGLPLRGRRVAIVGGTPTHSAPFFLDRLCKVTVFDVDWSPDQAPPTFHRLNLNAIAGGLPASADATPLETYDIGFATMPLLRADSIVPWIDGVAHLSQHILILYAQAVPGQGADLLLRRGRNGSAPLAMPTRPWIWERLRERFANVYTPRVQPCHAGFPLRWTAWGPSFQGGMTVFIASRDGLERNLLSTELLNVFDPAV